MSNKQNRLSRTDISRVKQVVHLMLSDKVVTPDDIDEALDHAINVFKIDIADEDLGLLKTEIHQERIVVMDPGGVITDKSYKPWLQERQADINWIRWNAYLQLMQQKGIPPVVLDSMHERNKTVLDLAGDPLLEGNWSRRGLVIGEVQSGKTSNYLALFNKAADSGYKIFILLAGHTDALRSQTQRRVDEGFIGTDTRKWIKAASLSELPANTKIGVGLNPAIKTGFHTTVNNDFSAHALHVGVHIEGTQTPVIFVIKKNKKILENLTNWLKNHAGADGKISTPMMLLDDEADYASINTRRADESPTAINNAIRDLLKVFTRNSYIGFTATPFANVLIDDETQEDLFPRNFIYSLGSPSNYFGPEQMFETDNEDKNRFIVPIEDAEELIDFKHKSGDSINELPDSLLDAVRAFYLSNTLRDLRSQNDTPRSMLVNVSRWVNFQKQVKELVSEFLSNSRALLKQDATKSNTEWIELERVYSEHFSDQTLDWQEVANQVCESIDAIKVELVNSKYKSPEWQNLYVNSNPRVIAVGGDLLSRGLTLEGLCTSYFYRRSLAYDTLMQMGRWFGYRDGYKDLCKLWIDYEVSIWFRDIADALIELNQELVEMASRGLEPKDFGLKVRCHPGAMLMVTARNKCLSGQIVETEVSTSSISKETTRLVKEDKEIQSNWKALLDLLSKVSKPVEAAGGHGQGNNIWTKVDQQIIGQFLADYTTDNAEPLFAEKILASFVKANVNPAISLWDLILVSGSGTNLAHYGLHGKAVKRTIMSKKNDETLYISGGRRRLGGPSDLSLALTESERSEVNKGQNPSQLDYRRKLKRPVLVIYPLEAKNDQNAVVATKVKDAKDRNKDYETYISPDGQVPFVGFGVSFPAATGKESDQPKIKYIVNKVWARLNRITVSVVDELEDAELDHD